MIPINEHMHWYLALVINPAAILSERDPAVKGVPRRSPRQARESPMLVDERDSPAPPSLRAQGAEKKAEGLLAAKAATSTERAITPDAPEAPETIAIVEIEDDAGMTDDPLDKVTSLTESPSAKVARASEASALPDDGSDKPSSVITSPSKGSRRTPTRIVPGESRRPSPPPPQVAPPPQETYVVVFDSLGCSHGPVKTVLRDYLRLEARDKHHVPDDTDLRLLGDPVHIDVSVPEQTNSCDCGVYLLHYFERFFSDPHKFFDIALASRRGLPTAKVVHKDWLGTDMSKRRAWWRALVKQLRAEQP